MTKKILLIVIICSLVFSLASCSFLIDSLIDGMIGGDSSSDEHNNDRHSHNQSHDDSNKKPPSAKKDDVPKGQLSGFIKPYRAPDNSPSSEPRHDNDYRDRHYNDEHETRISVGYASINEPECRYSGQPYNPETQPTEGVFIHTGNASLGNQYAAQLRAYYMPMAHNIDARGVDAKILMPPGTAIDIEDISFHETVANRTDQISYFKLTHNVARWSADTNFDSELGVGFSFLNDVDKRSYDSLCLKGSLDYFPKKPWGLHLKASYAAPTYRNLIDIDARAGIYAGPVELFVGYHTLINSVGDSLDGPIFGCALWF